MDVPFRQLIAAHMKSLLLETEISGVLFNLKAASALLGSQIKPRAG
jgi:hypothetical protein